MANEFRTGMYVVWCHNDRPSTPQKIIYMINETEAVNAEGGHMDLSDSAYRAATQDELDKIETAKNSYANEVSQLFAGIRSEMAKLESIYLGKK